MKRKILPLIVLICFLLTSINVNANEPGQSTANYIQIPHTVYYVDNENYSAKKLKSIQDATAKMPDYLIDYFRQEGVKIYYNEGVPLSERIKNNNGTYDAACIEPLVMYSQATLKVDGLTRRPHIYVYDNVDSTAILHEYGHAYDMIAGYITGTYRGEFGISGMDQWKTLYQNNKSALKGIDNYTITNVGIDKSEAFAEAFRLYFAKPDALKRKCPDIYNFLNDTINRYKVYIKPIEEDNFDSEAYLTTYTDVASKIKDTNKKTVWNYYCQKGKALGHKAVCKIPKG